jgi:hypothetical protein
MSESDRPLRYAALVIIVLVLAAIVLPSIGMLNDLGYVGAKTYLLVLQDNTELRNTGGLMACVGSVEVQNGALQNLKLYYSQSNAYANGTLSAAVNIGGPESFTAFYNTTYVRFWDMNVQYDFATFAPLYASAWQQLTGQHSDGVIGLDLTGLQALLKATGPVTVANETITWRNVIDRVHFADVATKGEAGQPALNTFLGQLASKIITAAQTANPAGKLLVLSTLHTLAQQQHLLIYAPGALTSYNGAIQQQPGDYLYVVDANSGSAKADLDVNRTITDHVYLAANGTQTSNVTITYANNCGWTYKVFTTTLVPDDAALLNAQYNSSYHLGPLVTYADNLTTISSYVEVPAHSTGNVTYEYSLPSTLLPAGVFSHYDLYVQKQAGIDQFTLNTAVTLPQGAQVIHESNVGNGIVANGDVQVEVIYR